MNTATLSPSSIQASPDVFVVIAVFRPDPAHLTAQLASLAAQRGCTLHLVAVIADIVSGPLVRETADALDLKLEMVPSDQELDAVRAFESGLTEVMAMIDAQQGAQPMPLIALCDQDDIWHPDRLATGIAALESSGAQLVHSDARLVAADGSTEIQRSMFRFERRQRRPGLRGLLYRNNITGMTVLMRADVVRMALPFPQQSGVHFYHDLWLGLIAQATGGVHLIETPLVDYRQHGGNVMGAIDRQGGWLRGLRRRRPDAMWIRREAASYALARYLAQSLHTRLLDMIDEGHLARNSMRTRSLWPYLRRGSGGVMHFIDMLRLAITGHFGLARIAAGFAVVSIGRSVWSLSQAFGPMRRSALDGFDARLYSLSPGMPPRMPRLSDPREEKPLDHTALVDLRKTPRWTPNFSASAPALTVLVPTLNPTEVFAGIVTAFDIGLGLAARGFRVRFICTDLPMSSPGASRAFLLRRLPSGVPIETAARVSLHCGIHSPTLSAHRGDVFLATAWWTAHIAQKLILEHRLEQSRFFYLVQDFEPNFYPWGSEFADAMASYDFDFEPIFNTTLLRNYFAAQSFGFANEDALAFHPSIDIARYADAPRPLRAAGPRRLALYGRPEVARNMYPSAIEALAGFVKAEGLGPQDIELVSIGLSHAPVELPGGLQLTSLGKLPWEEYPAYLRSVDVGLSLMYSPHPSHPPIEMAASGVRVVTNSFGPKNLSLLSPAIASVPASVPEITAALRRVWAMPPVLQADRRIDIDQLGLDQNTMLDRLSEKLAQTLSRHKDAA